MASNAVIISSALLIAVVLYMYVHRCQADEPSSDRSKPQGATPRLVRDADAEADSDADADADADSDADSDDDADLVLAAESEVKVTAPTADDINASVRNLHDAFLSKSKDEKQRHMKAIFGTRLSREVDMPPARKKHFPRSQDPVLEKALGRGEFHIGARVTRRTMPQPVSDAYTHEDHAAFHAETGAPGCAGQC